MILWFLLRAGQKGVAERRWTGVIEEDMSAFRGIVKTTLSQQRAKSKDIAGEREFAVIAAIDLKRSAMISGVKTLEVADDKSRMFRMVRSRCMIPSECKYATPSIMSSIHRLTF